MTGAIFHPHTNCNHINTNPDPNNPNHNHTPRMENNLEQIELSVPGMDNIICDVIFHPGRTNRHDRHYSLSPGTEDSACLPTDGAMD